jgi:hypothetical protein
MTRQSADPIPIADPIKILTTPTVSTTGKKGDFNEEDIARRPCGNLRHDTRLAATRFVDMERSRQRQNYSGSYGRLARPVDRS